MLPSKNNEEHAQQIQIVRNKNNYNTNQTLTSNREARYGATKA